MYTGQAVRQSAGKAATALVIALCLAVTACNDNTAPDGGGQTPTWTFPAPPLAAGGDVLPPGELSHDATAGTTGKVSASLPPQPPVLASPSPGFAPKIPDSLTADGPLGGRLPVPRLPDAGSIPPPRLEPPARTPTVSHPPRPTVGPPAPSYGGSGRPRPRPPDKAPIPSSRPQPPAPAPTTPHPPRPTVGPPGPQGEDLSTSEPRTLKAGPIRPPIPTATPEGRTHRVPR